MKKGLIDKTFVNTVIKRRENSIHKGDLGKVLIVAGSKGMAGAAALCAKAALRTGSGLVQIAVSDEIMPIVQTLVPEATCLLRETSKIHLDQYDAVAFGPGLGDTEENKELLIWILKNYDKSLVLDADGLNLLAKYQLKENVKKSQCKIILTPHIGEAKRILNKNTSPESDDEKRMEMAFDIEKNYEAIAVLKGYKTVVAIDGETAYINTTGNPGMATAGSGDVLTGIITSLLGQGLSAEDSAMAGVFLHGLAGDIMAEKIGQYGLNSWDLTTGVALAIKDVVGN